MPIELVASSSALLLRNPNNQKQKKRRKKRKMMLPEEYDRLVCRKIDQVAHLFFFFFCILQQLFQNLMRSMIFQPRASSNSCEELSMHTHESLFSTLILLLTMRSLCLKLLVWKNQGLSKAKRLKEPSLRFLRFTLSQRSWLMRRTSTHLFESQQWVSISREST